MRLKGIKLKHLKHFKSMTYDEMSNWLQIATGGVAVITFIVGLATVWVTLKANTEKDIKAKEQEERIARVNLKVEEESRKRAEAERALLELQERLKARRLTENQKANLLNHLKGKAKGKIEISCENNTEAMTYAEDWKEVLQNAGWEVTGVIILLTPSNLRDTWVNVRTVNTAPVLALQQAIMAEKIELKFNNDPDKQKNDLQLFVCTKS